MSGSDEKALLDLKKKIDEAKVTLGQLKGQREYLLGELKTKFGCNSVEEATKKVTSMERQIAKIDNEIDTGVKAIETKYKEEE